MWGEQEDIRGLFDGAKTVKRWKDRVLLSTHTAQMSTRLKIDLGS
jgi:hypothetical protein